MHARGTGTASMRLAAVNPKRGVQCAVAGLLAQPPDASVIHAGRFTAGFHIGMHAEKMRQLAGFSNLDRAPYAFGTPCSASLFHAGCAWLERLVHAVVPAFIP